MSRTMVDYESNESEGKSRTMVIYESNESEGKTSWLWSKAVSVGKKVLTAGVVVSSVPLLFPPLVVASTIALISSVPFCLFLANYACTQKVMGSLLPPNEETSGREKDESGFEDVKLGRQAELVLIQREEDEEIAKESTSLIEKIRDEGRPERGTSEKELQDVEKTGNAKSEKVQDQTEKQEAPETGQEGKLGSTTTEASTGKDEETSSNEVYSEEQIWEKMEASRKVVGYSVARSATCAEELKALYVFTGVVEPPRSSLNQDGLDIANECYVCRGVKGSLCIHWCGRASTVKLEPGRS